MAGPAPDALSNAKLGRLPKPRLSKIAHSEPVMRARCPACQITGDVDLRTLDWHRSAAVTALTPALSYRSCRPNAPFAELVCLSKSSVADLSRICQHHRQHVGYDGGGWTLSLMIRAALIRRTFRLSEKILG